MKVVSKALSTAFLFSLLTFFGAFAQTPVEFGVRGGVGMGTMYNNTDANYGTKTLFTGGMYIDMPMSRYSAIRAELNLVNKGAEDDAYIFNRNYQSVSLTYLQFPLMGEVKLPQLGNIQPGLYAGPAFNFKLDYQLERADDGPSRYDDPVMSQLEMSFLVGAGVDLEPYNFDVRYDYGLSNTFTMGETSTGGFYFTVGYDL